MAEPISIDDLLEEQEKPSNLATIERIEGDETNVKVTPWSATGGCHCGSALQIPKSAIVAVRKTGQSHLCCGKLIPICEVEIAEDATVTIASLFAQAVANMEAASLSHGPNLPHGGHTQPGDIAPISHASAKPATDFALPPGGKSQCPEGYQTLHCNGIDYCTKTGAYCCGAGYCNPNQSCMSCGGNYFCAPSGSTCCGSGVCPPGSYCTMTGSGYVCRAWAPAR